MLTPNPSPVSDTVQVRSPDILALDFDGVLCDGMLEYFQTAWRVYCRLWLSEETAPPEGLATAFARMRPVVETGWEMPLVLHALLTGVSEAEILTQWSAMVPQLAAAEHQTPASLGAAVDGLRDEWIAADVESWLALHRFYPGVCDRLKHVLASSVYPIIISTKEGRFISQLLYQQGIELPESQVVGKEVRQPKAQTLRQLLQAPSPTQTPDPQIWFIEDRLKTLQSIQTQADLAPVRLFLAEWGYNTEQDRAIARQDGQISLLSPAQFTQDFAQWLTPYAAGNT